MKRCSKCKNTKNLEEFNKCKSNSDGYQYVCKICQKEWRDNNKEYIKQKDKEYQTKNKEKLREYGKEYNEKNKEKRKKYHIDYRIKNKDVIKERKRNYNTSEQGRKTRREWFRKDYKKNPHKYILRTVLKKTLKCFGKEKSDKTVELLGYSPNQLKIHIEKLFQEGMNWENYGEWHIDHIKPVSVFDDDTPMDVVNALSNLQPLWQIDNLEKSNQY